MSTIIYYTDNKLSVDKPDTAKYWEIKVRGINGITMFYHVYSNDNYDIVQCVNLTIVGTNTNSNINSAISISNGKDHEISIKLDNFKSNMLKLHQLLMAQHFDENEIIILIDKLLNHKDSLIYKYNQYKSALDDF